MRLYNVLELFSRSGPLRKGGNLEKKWLGKSMLFEEGQKHVRERFLMILGSLWGPFWGPNGHFFLNNSPSFLNLVPEGVRDPILLQIHCVLRG